MGKKMKTDSHKKLNKTTNSDYEEYRESADENYDTHQDVKKVKKKEKYIPFRSLNCWFEIIKIIQGTYYDKGVEFDLLVKNKRNSKDFKVKVNSSKLKYVAPLLLCEYYEKHIID